MGNSLPKEHKRKVVSFSTRDEVQDALRKAGLETSSLILGIDFTKSNKLSGRCSFSGKSLHHLDSDELNPYEQAISIVGKTMADFNDDDLIPCFGFGDLATTSKAVFGFYGNSRPCKGFEEVLSRYREIVPHVQPSGPTSFAPIIYMAMKTVEQSGGKYHVLVIIADGQVTCAEEKDTMAAIVAASKYALSIIIVGVGDGPWDKMQEFDENIPRRCFDNIHFVNFTELVDRSKSPEHNIATFSVAALKKLPSQYKAIIELKLRGQTSMFSAYKLRNVTPLPPPTIWNDYASSEALEHLEARPSKKRKIEAKGNEFKDTQARHFVEDMQVTLSREEEDRERRRKEKAEAHLHTVIKVSRDEDLASQIGKSIIFDLVDHERVKSFRVLNQTLFLEFKKEVEKEFNIPVHQQRFWLWAKRQNQTYRPYRPLDETEEIQSVVEIPKGRQPELRLFLEVRGVPNSMLPLKTPDDEIMLFFKFYVPEKKELRYLGRLTVKKGGRPEELKGKLKEMARLPANTEIKIYEEIISQPKVMCEPVNETSTYLESQLENGDILCYQASRYWDVPSFLNHAQTEFKEEIIHFRHRSSPNEDEFCLNLLEQQTYDDVVNSVAMRLGLDDPSKIRLTARNCYSNQPKPQAIKYRGVNCLREMLVHYNQRSNVLYFETLDLPLPEFQNLKTLKVVYHNSRTEEVAVYNVRLPKFSTVWDVIKDLKEVVSLSSPNADLRLLEVFGHKLYQVFPLSEKVENISDRHWTLRAEEIPEEEKHLSPQDRLIHVYHFTRDDPSTNKAFPRNFGEPFLLAVRENETLEEVKERIQMKLQIPGNEFTEWKFAFVSLGRVDYLSNSDIVLSRFQRAAYNPWEHYLGAEH